MKAISLWQPWASAWCSPLKIHETRHWPINHRGWLAVHATKKIVHACGAELDDIICDEFGPHWRMELPRGAIIGAVNIVNCERTEDVYDPQSVSERDDNWLCGDFSPGRFAWERREFRIFQNPVPYRGAQGIFFVPDDLFPKAEAA